MSNNWTNITTDDLKAIGHGLLVDKARTTATGSIDPVEEVIADAVARVRRAVAAGNTLDADEAKVPNSLKSVAMRLAVFALSERIRMPLSDDQRETRRNDYNDLMRIHDSRQRVEQPDAVAHGLSEIQSEPNPKIHCKHRDFTNRTMDGI